MRTTGVVGLAAAVVALGLLLPIGARGGEIARASIGSLTVEAEHLQGALGGPWEFSKGVVLTGKGIRVTCERLSVWPTKTGRDIEKAEATGNVVVSGRYVAADGTEWQVNGKSTAASYDQKAGQGVLRGSVSFTGKNLADGSVVTVAADKLLFLVKERKFQFERGAEPVKVRWEEPETAAKQAGDSTASKKSGEEGGKAQEGSQ